MERVHREVSVGLGSSQEGYSSWCPKQIMARPCGTKKKREKGKRWEDMCMCQVIMQAFQDGVLVMEVA
jgi:hypothetical protein